MFTQFRSRYPQGSLITDLLAMDRGQFIVRCLIQVDGITLASGLAAAQTIELAEDQARSRALAVLAMDSTPATAHPEAPAVSPEVAVLPQPNSPIPQAVSSDNLEHIPSPELSPTSSSRSSGSNSRRKKNTQQVTTTSWTAEEKPDKATEQLTATSWAPEEKTFTDEFLMPEIEPSTEPEESPVMVTQPLSQSQLHSLVAPSYSPEELDESSSPSSPETPIDFSDIIARTNVELKRLGWTNQQGRDYLVQTYGKRSRQLLTDEELLDFLRHLESEPTPE
ncbi:MAG TPA: hypothetical protein DDZ80_01040 [Cyanobacteria bacterium UBA8803]|nr:hypothetical protein [Cyanobacteria bacterium UBA9273]HBL57193.1 hypothetical protein [Cyanobacteria bacterium UBA8803]